MEAPSKVFQVRPRRACLPDALLGCCPSYSRPSPSCPYRHCWGPHRNVILAYTTSVNLRLPPLLVRSTPRNNVLPQGLVLHLDLGAFEHTPALTQRLAQLIGEAS